MHIEPASLNLSDRQSLLTPVTYPLFYIFTLARLSENICILLPHIMIANSKELQVFIC